MRPFFLGGVVGGGATFAEPVPRGTAVGGVGALRGGAAFTSSAVGGVLGMFAPGGVEGFAEEIGEVSFGAGGTSPGLLIVWDPGRIVSSAFFPSA
jgi:hypothetical protein